ncbi:MAG: universal stress protein [Coriobacteriales bacterium]
MFSKILVPYDGSDHAQSALLTAIELLRKEEHGDIVVLHVPAPVDFDDSTFEIAARMAGVTETAKEVRKSYLSKRREDVEKSIEKFFESVPVNIDIKIVVLSGRPQDVIVDYVKDDTNKIDCIVMGRRGLGAIRSAIGSVSFAVLHSVDLPVMLVK